MIKLESQHIVELIVQEIKLKNPSMIQALEYHHELMQVLEFTGAHPFNSPREHTIDEFIRVHEQILAGSLAEPLPAPYGKPQCHWSVFYRKGFKRLSKKRLPNGDIMRHFQCPGIVFCAHVVETIESNGCVCMEWKLSDFSIRRLKELDQEYPGRLGHWVKIYGIEQEQ